ncbi:hypothetical protein KUTeg_001485 [Tegillarca granosa]|uniref:J domain-containing protein n=1 Tax=Tegillarca granosa TaxID=220873 RepID=A0ABQ9FRL6_TEGGR|nr:hypothetical protein KUTeg_001485 [Tegillarca granosa]
MKALNSYTDAINLCPTCAAYYGNRAATYMMLNKYKDALEDARHSVRLDKNFLKGYMREAKCHLALGETAAAARCYEKILEFEPGNTVAKAEYETSNLVQKFEGLAETDFEKGDYRRVVFYMDRCLEKCPACARFKVKKGECLAFLGRYQEAQEIAKLKAKLLNAKKEEGNTAFRGGKLDEAYRLYTEALQIDPNNKFTNSKLYNNRATVSAKLGKVKEAADDCTKAIELDENYVKAYLRRAKCYMDLEQYEDAVRDYEKVCKMDKNKENSRLLQDAKLELKKSKRKDYYKILGITKNASNDEIKKAYKKRALVHHPDVDPNQIFQTFFGGGGPGFFGGGPGFHQQSGFPGGFSFQFG